jgi:hypothetical protein
MILRMLMVCRSPDDGVGGGGGGADAAAGQLAALQAERAKRQAAEDRLAAIEAASKAAEEERAAKAGEYKNLYDPLKAEHEKATARITEFEKREAERTERVKTRNDARIAALPEKAAKALAPIAAALPPEALAEWMDDHLADLVAEAAPARPAGTIAGTGRAEPIPPEATVDWQKYGKNLGVTEREWFEKNWKPRQKKTT